MTKKPEFELTFNLNVLHHLGVGLYSNIPAVLSEMVANAWDSGATEVNITLDKDLIVIEDNGIGMSLSELNERFLRVGYQRRKEEPVLVVDGKTRHVMGRKGIGKLSAFSIANLVKIQTSKDGIKNGFSMSRTELEQEIDKGSLTYFPTPVDATQITIEQGTKVVLQDIRQSDLGLEQELRTNLARRFSVINRAKEFEVIVNGTPITLKDRNYYEKIQFMWYLGNESEFYTERCPNLKHKGCVQNVIDEALGYKVSGWIATVAKPKDIDDEHHAISIFANGKLIQENILPEIQDARIYRQYIIGELDADFIDADNDVDIVTSDRQRINQTDPRYILLKRFLSNELKQIGNSWDQLRLRNKPAQSAKGVGRRQTVSNLQPTLLDQTDADPTDSSPNEHPFSGTSRDPIETELLATEDISNSIVEAPSGDHTARPGRPPSREAQAIFSTIRQIVEASTLEESIKEIIVFDLDQARLSYYGTAYKACVVMLGAVLEGLMLGRLRQPDMLQRIQQDTNLPKSIKHSLGGTQNPSYSNPSDFADALSERLGFDEYRILLCTYVPDLLHLGVENIQHFRNSIHPWRSVQKPTIYKTNTPARVMAYLGSLESLTRVILA